MESSAFPSKSPFDESSLPLNPGRKMRKLSTMANDDGKWRKKCHKKRQLAIIGFLLMANFFIWISASSSSPFFAIEATERKGQTLSQVGLCNGISQLFMAVFAPLCGKYMALIRDDLVNSIGLVIFSFSTFFFGFCNFITPGWPFFFAILFARILGGVGICAIVTGGWAILGRLFPDRVSMLRGVGETVNGIGFALGPLLGSTLYDVGGFMLPLMVTGSLIALMAFLSFGLPFLIEHKKEPNEEEENTQCEEQKMGIFELLKIPNIFLCVCCLLLMSIGWFFYEPSLAAHLATFSPARSSAEIAALMGWMMTSLSGIYALFAPFWGLLFERYFVHCQTAIMLLGSAGISLSLILMGPSPFLGLPKSVPLMFAAFIINGIFSAVLYVPMFRWCRDAVKAKGYDEKCSATNGLIAGIHHSVFSFGAFVGTSLGGVSAQHFGFAWTATGVAILQLSCICLQFCMALTTSKQPTKAQKIEEVENEGKLIV